MHQAGGELVQPHGVRGHGREGQQQGLEAEHPLRRPAAAVPDPGAPAPPPARPPRGPGWIAPRPGPGRHVAACVSSPDAPMGRWRHLPMECGRPGRSWCVLSQPGFLGVDMGGREINILEGGKVLESAGSLFRDCSRSGSLTGGGTFSFQDGILNPHAASCTCAACCDDMTLVSVDSPPAALAPAPPLTPPASPVPLQTVSAQTPFSHFPLGTRPRLLGERQRSVLR